MADIVIPYTPRPDFLAFHARKQRWAILVAHRRAGKTVASAADLVANAAKHPKPPAGVAPGRYAYIAPLYKQAKDVAWQYFKDLSGPLIQAGLAKANESELRIDYSFNGARIKLYGADNPDALRGLYLDGCDFDEYSQMRPSLWSQVIRPALADRKGWATFKATPKGRNAFYDRWQEALRNPSEWFSLMLKASETGLIDPLELAAAAREMTEDEYAQEFECSFEAAIVGAYYGRDVVRAEQEGRIRAVSYNPALPVDTVWDIGYTDDTVIIFYQVSAGEIHIIDAYASNGQSVQHYCETIKAQPYEYGEHWLPHDAQARQFAAAGRTVLEQMRAEGIKNLKIVPRGQSEQQGILAARQMFPRVWFDEENCEDLLEALRQFQRVWDESRQTFADHPRRDWTNHYADAFRGLAWVWRQRKEPAVPEPALTLTIGGQSTMRFNDLLKESTRRRVGKVLY